MGKLTANFLWGFLEESPFRNRKNIVDRPCI